MYLDKAVLMNESDIIEIRDRIKREVEKDDVEGLLALSVLNDALERGKVFKNAGTEPVYLYVGKYKIDVISKLLLENKLH